MKFEPLHNYTLGITKKYWTERFWKIQSCFGCYSDLDQKIPF